MARRIAPLVVFAATTLAAASASAHITLTYPTPRYDPTQLKTGPCGMLNGPKSANVTTFKPGDKIVVKWDETIDHPGHFRIAFDDDGDDAFQDPAAFDDIGSGAPILIDGIADKNGGAYEQEITLPDIECDNCTLQVIQVMTDKAPYGDGNDIYYQCADLVLSNSGAGGGGTGGSAAGGSGTGATGQGGDGTGNTSQGGSGSTSSGAPTEFPSNTSEDDGGCSLHAGTTDEPGAWLPAALAALGLAASRRRRRA